jgi:hypothetical protein
MSSAMADDTGQHLGTLCEVGLRACTDGLVQITDGHQELPPGHVHIHRLPVSKGRPDVCAVAGRAGTQSHHADTCNLF